MASPLAQYLQSLMDQKQSVPWQKVYDPIQKYYWENSLGGTTVQVRDFLGYDDPSTSEKERYSKEDWMNNVLPILSMTQDTEHRLEDYKNYSDWKDSSIKDFANNYNKYVTTSDLEGATGPVLDYLLLKTSPTTRNSKFQALFSPSSTNALGGRTPEEWLRVNNIDLDVPSTWDFKTPDSSDPNTRAIQEAIRDENVRNFMADPNESTMYDQYFRYEQKPLRVAAKYLNTLAAQEGLTGEDFLKHPDVKKWAKAVDKANPSDLSRFVSSPAFGFMTGIATAGLSGPLSSTISAAAPSLSKTAAQVLAQSALGAGTAGVGAAATGGNMLKALARGGISGGLGQYAAGTAAGQLTNMGVPNMLAKALGQGTIQGGTSALLGGDFSAPFVSGMVSGGLGAAANQYVSPELAELGLSPAQNKWLTSQLSKAASNTFLNRKTNPKQVALSGIMSGTNALMKGL